MCTTNAIASSKDREASVQALEVIAFPILDSLSRGQLNATLIIESPESAPCGRNVTIAAAFARLMAGIGPWLELGEDETPEGKIRGQYIELAKKAWAAVFTIDSPDYVDWNPPAHNGQRCNQMACEAAFIGHAILRNPTLFGELPEAVRQGVLASMNKTYALQP